MIVLIYLDLSQKLKFDLYPVLIQRQCQDLGLIIPSIAYDNFASLGSNTGNDNNYETYCGTFLNPLSGQTVSGTVTGDD